MRVADAAPVSALAAMAFEDLGRRLHEPAGPLPEAAGATVRLRHILATDPGGCWVSEDAGGLTGVGMALLREGLWGLSLLVVRPDQQSSGIGTALLARTLEYGSGAHGGIILASSDTRALRAYARAGFALHPTLQATGRPHDVAPAPEVRPFERADHEFAATVDRFVRGAARGADIAALAAAGNELLRPSGAVCLRGKVGAMRPYLPGGAFL